MQNPQNIHAEQGGYEGKNETNMEDLAHFLPGLSNCSTNNSDYYRCRKNKACF